MNASFFRQLDNGAWADADPFTCPCGGGGWFTSDYDTHHACPYHDKGQPHPEMDDDDFDYAAARREIYGEWYETIMKRASQLNLDDLRPTPEAPVRDFAEMVDRRVAAWKPRHKWQKASDYSELYRRALCAGQLLEELEADMRELSARREGYSCDLERRLEAEAERERHEAEVNGWRR